MLDFKEFSILLENKRLFISDTKLDESVLILLSDIDESMLSRGWESIKKNTSKLYDLLRSDKKTYESVEQYARVLESPKTAEDRRAKECFDRLKEEAEKAKNENGKFRIKDVLTPEQIIILKKHSKNFFYGIGAGFLVTVFPLGILFWAIFRLLYPLIILKGSQSVDDFIKSETANREKEKEEFRGKQRKEGYYTRDSIEDIEFEVVENEKIEESVSLVAASLVGIFTGALIANWLKLSLDLRRERKRIEMTIDPEGKREIFKNIDNIRKNKTEIENEITRRAKKINRETLTEDQKRRAMKILSKIKKDLEID